MEDHLSEASFDTEVECFVNSTIVNALEELELENSQCFPAQNSNGRNGRPCDRSASKSSVISSHSSSVPSLKALACGVVRGAGLKVCEQTGILRFINGNSEENSDCSVISSTFSDFSPCGPEMTLGFSTPKKVEKTKRCGETSKHVDQGSIRHQLAQAYRDGYEAALEAEAQGSSEESQNQIITKQNRTISRLAAEKDLVESILSEREKEWYLVSKRLIAEINDLRSAYYKLINESTHESVRLSGHAYNTLFRSLHTNDQALSTSVQLQMKINEQLLHMYTQERYIDKLEARLVDLEDQLISIRSDGGYGDEPPGVNNVVVQDRHKYQFASDHVDYNLVENFEIGGTGPVESIPGCHSVSSDSLSLSL